MQDDMATRADTEPVYRSIWNELKTVSFRQSWVDAGGVRTRFVEAGPADAPCVVMLHGTGGSWEAFCANLGAHARHFHCFAYDLVGSGFSDKPDHDYEIPVYVAHLRAFMAAMRIDKASLIGVSLGAWIAARFALDHPGLVHKLTLMSAAGLIATESNMKQIKTLRGGAAANPTWDNIKAIFDNLIHAPANRIDDLVALRQAVYRQPGMADSMAHVLCLQDMAIRRRNLLGEAQWKAITTPALVIGSAQDVGEYLDTARHVADVMPNARYVEIEDVRHWPQFEAPARFNALNIAFLEE